MDSAADSLSLEPYQSVLTDFLLSAGKFISWRGSNEAISLSGVLSVNQDEKSSLAEFCHDRPSTPRRFIAPTAALEGISSAVSLNEGRSAD